MIYIHVGIASAQRTDGAVALASKTTDGMKFVVEHEVNDCNTRCATQLAIGVAPIVAAHRTNGAMNDILTPAFLIEQWRDLCCGLVDGGSGIHRAVVQSTIRSRTMHAL